MAVWTDTPPTLDGDISEALWSQAPKHGGFVERKPALGASPKDATFFRVAFDLDHLYVAIVAEDSETPVGRSRARDSFVIFRDDALSLKIDAKNDRRTTFGFVLNPVGGRLDYLGVDEGSFKREVDHVWEGAAAKRADGWSIEVAIPWSSLGIDPATAPDAIGFNISRDHARRNATYDWSLMPPPYGALSASLYGRIRGFEALREKAASTSRGPIQSWFVTPYVLGGADGTPGLEPFFDAGLDAGLELGPLRLAATVNTDFAQVDLDDQTVNLTRFSLFLPEKRGFFLRDLELFQAGLSGRAQLLHTRRIGLQSGAAVPILGGLKLTTRAGSDVGVGGLFVVTDKQDGRDRMAHLAVRGQAELGRGSNVGVMVTDRRSLSSGSDYNTVVALDGAWRGPEGLRPLLLTAFAALSMTGDRAAARADGLVDDELAASASAGLEWRGSLWRPSVRYLFVAQDFNPELGFFRRRGIHTGEAAVEVEPRLSGDLERLNVELSGSVSADDQARELLDWDVDAEASLRWDAGYRLTAGANVNHVLVESPFGIGDVEVPAGRYDGWEVAAAAATPSTHELSASTSFRGGDFFGGTRVGGDVSMAYRPGPLLRLELSGRYDWVSFGDARPNQHLGAVNGRVAIGFTDAVGLDVFAGWGATAALLKLQSRLRWAIAPGSDLFLVYQFDVDTDATEPQFQSLIGKFTWRFGS